MQRVTLWPSKRSAAAADAGDAASPVRIQTPDVRGWPCDAAGAVLGCLQQPTGSVVWAYPLTVPRTSACLTHASQVAAFYLRDERLRLTRLQQQRLRRLAEEAPWLLPLTRRQLQKVLATSGGTACICEADPALAPDKDEPGAQAVSLPCHSGTRTSAHCASRRSLAPHGCTRLHGCRARPCSAGLRCVAHRVPALCTPGRVRREAVRFIAFRCLALGCHVWLDCTTCRRGWSGCRKEPCRR